MKRIATGRLNHIGAGDQVNAFNAAMDADKEAMKKVWTDTHGGKFSLDALTRGVAIDSTDAAGNPVKVDTDAQAQNFMASIFGEKNARFSALNFSDMYKPGLVSKDGEARLEKLAAAFGMSTSDAKKMLASMSPSDMDKPAEFFKKATQWRANSAGRIEANVELQSRLKDFQGAKESPLAKSGNVVDRFFSNNS